MALHNESIIKAYQSGSYTIKDLGGHFKIHYSLVSSIVVASKKQVNSTQKPAKTPSINTFIKPMSGY